MAYRAVKTMPPANKILARKEADEQHQRHLKRLSKVRADIDNDAPRRFPHLENRKKKEQKLKERYDQIEYENHVLLQKMHDIMSRNALDDHNTGPPPKSLNSHRRKKELERIMVDNQKILARIQQQKPFYKKQEWDAHAKRHEQRLKGMQDSEMRERKSKQKDKQTQRKGAGSSTRSRSAATSKRKKASGAADSERVIFKNGMQLGEKYVVVTVLEIMRPHVLSFRTYDLDSSDAESVDVLFPEVELLVQSELGDTTLLESSRREELAKRLCEFLQFTPKLTFVRPGDEEDVKENKEPDNQLLQVSGGARDTADSPLPEDTSADLDDTTITRTVPAGSADSGQAADA